MSDYLVDMHGQHVGEDVLYIIHSKERPIKERGRTSSLFWESVCLEQLICHRLSTISK